MRVLKEFLNYLNNMDISQIVQSPVKVYEDARGTIENIESHFYGDIIYIRSKAGTARANHYHKQSGHLCYVTHGKITYMERPVGSKERPTTVDVVAGQSFWTGPMMEHIMVFNVDAEFICLSTGCRSQEEYEKDLVRLDFDLSKV